VIEARAAFDDELRVMESSVRAAADIKAKIKRSPGKTAAVAGSAAFVVFKGPQRLFRAGKRAVRGPAAPMPKSMLPEEIEKALHKLGPDGDKVRGALERDFADYAMKSKRERSSLRRNLLLAAGLPILRRGASLAADYLVSPDPEVFKTRLEELRQRATSEVERLREPDPVNADDD
jgi:hypothetical protein